MTPEAVLIRQTATPEGWRVVLETHGRPAVVQIHRERLPRDELGRRLRSMTMRRSMRQRRRHERG